MEKINVSLAHFCTREEELRDSVVIVFGKAETMEVDPCAIDFHIASKPMRDTNWNEVGDEVQQLTKWAESVPFGERPETYKADIAKKILYKLIVFEKYRDRIKRSAISHMGKHGYRSFYVLFEPTF